MNIAIVTGASSGMGREFVKQIDKAYTKLNEIWVIARRQDRLVELQRSVKTPLKIVPIDLTNRKQLQVLEILLAENKPTIKMLVNSAGYGIIGDFGKSDMKDAVGMIDLNCTALVSVTHICLPYMSNGSRIVQLASSAAFLPQPGFAIYAATKSFVLSFSRALNYEVADRGIYVTAVCPGPVKTEFFELAEKNASMPAYKKLTMVNAADVVKEALKASSDRRDVSVYGTTMKLFSVLTKICSHKWLLSIVQNMNEKQALKETKKQEKLKEKQSKKEHKKEKKPKKEKKDKKE